MSKTEGKDFMDDPVVDRLTDEILDALETSAAAHGLEKVRSVAIVAIASDGTGGGVSGVLSWGCTCLACQVEMVTVLAEARGATATLTLRKPGETPPEPQVH